MADLDYTEYRGGNATLRYSHISISCKGSVLTHSHAELGLIKEDSQKPAKPSHVGLVWHNIPLHQCP